MSRYCGRFSRACKVQGIGSVPVLYPEWNRMDARTRKKCQSVSWTCGFVRKLTSFSFVSATLGACLWAGISTETVQADAKKPPERMLLLDNRNILHGALTADSESFHLQLEGGGKMTIARRRVLCICDSKIEAYRFLAEKINVADLTDRVKLISWCLQHRLLSAASYEIESLGRDAPKHPDLERLKVRLEFLSAPARQTVPRVGTARMATRPVSNAKPPKVSNAATTEFAKHIQPLLINSCGTVGCHGRGGTTDRMPLTSPPRKMNWNPRLMQRNLTAVLREVDFVHPERSPLFQSATTPHAGQAALFRVGKSKYAEDLAAWIAEITGKTVIETDAAKKATNGEEDAVVVDEREVVPPAGSSPPASDPLNPEVFNLEFGKPKS